VTTIKGFLIWLLSILATGLLLLLAMPLMEQAYLAWFALVPLLLTTRGKGFLFGFLGSLGSLFFAAWLSSKGYLFPHHGGADDPWPYTGYGIFGISFAVTFGVWADRGSRKMPSWWFAAIGTLLEAVLLIKLPAHLALSQFRNALLVQLASVGGSWSISFLVWWANFALTEGVLEGRWRMRTARVLGPAVMTVVLGGLWIPANGPSKTFAALQIAETEPDAMRAAQERAAKAGASLAVWPEFGGLSFAPNGNTKGLRIMPPPAFVTSFRDDAQPLPHNVAALFSGGIESVRYAKRKLFGEETKMHLPGDRAVAVDGVGLNICFDSCFPQVIRETARLGPPVVALPTIDPPGANGFLAAFHSAYTPFRAAESGVAIVRADGYARSMIVDARGKIVAEAGMGDEVISAPALIGPRWTVSKLLGDWFLWFCGGLILWPSAAKLAARFKRRDDVAVKLLE